MASDDENTIGSKRAFEPGIRTFPDGESIESAYMNALQDLKTESKLRHGRVAPFWCPHRNKIKYKNINDSESPKFGHVHRLAIRRGNIGNEYKQDVGLAVKLYPPTITTQRLGLRLGIIAALNKRNDIYISPPEAETDAQHLYRDFVVYTDTLAVIDVDFRQNDAGFWTEKAVTKVDTGKSMTYTVDMSNVEMKMNDELSGHMVISSCLDPGNTMYWRANIDTCLINEHIADLRCTLVSRDAAPAYGFGGHGSADVGPRAGVPVEKDIAKAMSGDIVNLDEFTHSGRLELAATRARLYKYAMNYNGYEGAMPASPASDTSEGCAAPVMYGDGLLHGKAKDNDDEGVGNADRDGVWSSCSVQELHEKYTKELQKTTNLTKLILGLPPLVGFSHALDYVGVKEEFERFYKKTIYSKSPMRLYDFNMHAVHQKTSNVFCFLMSDTQRRVVIDRMVHAFDNGHGSMRNSYGDLFQKFAREVEYDHNRHNEDKKAKAVQSNRSKLVQKLTQHFNDVVDEVYLGDI